MSFPDHLECLHLVPYLHSFLLLLRNPHTILRFLIKPVLSVQPTTIHEFCLAVSKFLAHQHIIKTVAIIVRQSESPSNKFHSARYIVISEHRDRFDIFNNSGLIHPLFVDVFHLDELSYHLDRSDYSEPCYFTVNVLVMQQYAS